MRGIMGEILSKIIHTCIYMHMIIYTHIILYMHGCIHAHIFDHLCMQILFVCYTCMHYIHTDIYIPKHTHEIVK